VKLVLDVPNLASDAKIVSEAPPLLFEVVEVDPAAFFALLCPSR
jgi:hypothetical protein